MKGVVVSRKRGFTALLLWHTQRNLSLDFWLCHLATCVQWWCENRFRFSKKHQLTGGSEWSLTSVTASLTSSSPLHNNAPAQNRTTAGYSRVSYCPNTSRPLPLHQFSQCPLDSQSQSQSLHGKERLIDIYRLPISSSGCIFTLRLVEPPMQKQPDTAAVPGDAGHCSSQQVA